MESETLGALLKGVATVVVGVPLLAYLLQERLIYYPQPLSEAALTDTGTKFPKGQNVFAQASDGIKVHAWHLPGPPGAPLVLYFGGNAEQASAGCSYSIIPAEHAKLLFDAWGGPKRWVALEEAGHNTVDAHPNYWPSINAFLSERPS